MFSTHCGLDKGARILGQCNVHHVPLLLVQNRIEINQTVLCNQALVNFERWSRARHIDGRNQTSFIVQVQLFGRICLNGILVLCGQEVLSMRSLGNAAICANSFSAVDRW